MNRKFVTFGLAGAAAAVALLSPELALAQSGNASGAGESGLAAFQDLFLGNVGLMVGLAIAAFGLWKWLMDQTSWGIILIIGGVLITAFPGLFGSAQKFVRDVTPFADSSRVSPGQ